MTSRSRLGRTLYGAILIASLAFLLTFAIAPAAFAADGDPVSSLSLSLALTAAGAVVFSAFITGITEVLTRPAGSPLKGHEQGFALVLSGIVVIAAIADSVSKGTMVIDIGTIFAGIVAWYGIVRVSMGIHDDVLDRNSTSSLGTNI